MDFQESSWNIYASNLVSLIPAASVLRYRVKKQTDTQTNGGYKTYPTTATGVSNNISTSKMIRLKVRPMQLYYALALFFSRAAFSFSLSFIVV